MPDTPFIVRKTSSRCSRMIDQMHNKYFRTHMSEEEKIAADESLKVYCQPRDLYVILQRHAIKNPLFLQRSLNYKIEAKHQRRIQMTLFLPGSKDPAGIQTQKLFPFFIVLAKLVSSKTTAECSAVYKFSRACILTGDDGVSQPPANFLLPRMDRLALDAKSGSLAILFISFAGAQNSQFVIDPSKPHSGGLCLWSKIPLESLYLSWQKYPNMDLGEKANSVSLVEMQPCFLQPKYSMTEKCFVIQVPSYPLTSSSPQQVQVTISAQEVGATENPPYRSSFSFNDIPASSVVLPISWLRKGQVAYTYRYYNNKLYRTEVTGDFTCPICFVKCASFKGVECHMPSTHDFFNFEFWVNEKYPAVNVSLKSETMINEFFNLNVHKKQIQITEGDRHARLERYPSSSKKSGHRKQKTPLRNPMPGPLKITDDANSVKNEKSQIPPGGAKLYTQLVPPRSPAELQMMQMWNSFVKERRVVENGRISLGCEAFSKLHGPLMVRNPDLLWCWTKYIWTLKIYGRIDDRTLKNCNLFIEQVAK
ncbi:Polycomb group protein EMBRYONIC FLOWER 2 [Raphanus sativus]|nr:Polycomb group protein EMBRYONIC FLOWER 2 [Raphanus sativus]